MKIVTTEEGHVQDNVRGRRREKLSKANSLCPAAVLFHLCRAGNEATLPLLLLHSFTRHGRGSNGKGRGTHRRKVWHLTQLSLRPFMPLLKSGKGRRVKI